MEIEILGTNYSFEENEQELLKQNRDGSCGIYTKDIKVRPQESMCEDDEREEGKKARWKEVLRHEIIHAFFFESGLIEYCDDEQLVNWLAIQLPKINTAILEAIKQSKKLKENEND